MATVRAEAFLRFWLAQSPELGLVVPWLCSKWSQLLGLTLPASRFLAGTLQSLTRWGSAALLIKRSFAVVTASLPTSALSSAAQSVPAVAMHNIADMAIPVGICCRRNLVA